MVKENLFDGYDGIDSKSVYALSRSKVTMNHTDVLYMDVGSNVYIQMNVENSSHYNANGTLLIIEELFFLELRVIVALMRN